MKPFDFHYRLRDHFKAQEKTWNWFSAAALKAEQTDRFRTELLKNTYRLNPQADAGVYAHVDKTKEVLGISLPVTVYQSQNTGENNAGIILMDGEVHLVLSGPVTALLNEQEMLALIAHELTHVLLYNLENGDFEITSRIIYAIANDYRSDESYQETARLYSLFTELFCDLGSLRVCGDGHAVVATLVKIQTGLSKVSSESYLKQSDEILDKAQAGSEGESHPESYIRAKSIALFLEKGEEAYPAIEALIFGQPGLFSLNLFSQKKVQQTTRRLLQLLLKPKWMQSAFNKAHAQLYFPDFQTDAEAVLTAELKEQVQQANTSLKDYYAYVMLDFALCDSELSEPASGLVLDLGEQVGLAESLGKAFKKEMELSDKRFDELAKNAALSLNRIQESERENPYE